MTCTKLGKLPDGFSAFSASRTAIYWHSEERPMLTQFICITWSTIALHFALEEPIRSRVSLKTDRN